MHEVVRTIRALALFLFIFACVLAAVGFSIQNEGTVVIKFLNWSSRALPQAMLLFLTFASGVMLAGLFFLIEMLRVRSKLRKARRMCEMLEREVDALRNQPLYDEVPAAPLATSPNSFDQRLSYDGQPEASVEQIEPKRAR